MTWIIVAIFFIGDAPMNSKLFALDPEQVKTQAECRVELAKLLEIAKKREADMWAECVEVKHETPKLKKERDS